jgi:hypothetical protein
MASDAGSSFSTPIHYPSVGGMDHVAIVWCRNLLSSVRNLIHSSYIPIPVRRVPVVESNSRQHNHGSASAESESSSERKKLQHKKIIDSMTHDDRSYRHKVEAESRALQKVIEHGVDVVRSIDIDE